jgi:cation:H+ antiporter
LIYNIIILVLGLVVLILGGEFLVRGSSNIAIRFKISPLVVGLTVVAFGTSAPELLISIQSALKGSPDLAMGNVIGSNICNLALVLGVTTIIYPIKVNSNSIKIDWPMTMGSSLLLYFLVMEGFVNSYEGVMFVIILVAYLVFIIKKSRKENQYTDPADLDIDPEEAMKSNGVKDAFYITLGAAGLFFGSEWFVGGARDLAIQFGIEERVIGITILALGTSLPELVTAIVASFKKQTDLAIGNLMGSNIFNILSILGITSIIQEIKVSALILNIDMIWMLGITLIILPMMLYKRQIGRPEGVLLVSIYMYYTYNVITHTVG